MKRNIYLNPLSFDDAQNCIDTEFRFKENHKTEIISVEDSLGRISSSPVIAKLSNPNHNAAAMDGISVKSASTHEADPRNPVKLSVDIDFKWVDTGDVLPDDMDAVIMMEDLSEAEQKSVVITSPAVPWQHVRPVGEDIVCSEMIIPSMHRIRPVDIGAMIGGGITAIEVIKKPVVGIIPSGTEIIETPDQMIPGAILDSNSRMFSAMVSEYGGTPLRYSPVKDDYKLLKEAVIKALEECDLVILGAGSSAGSEDFSKSIIEEIGTLLFHGIAIKPGKPAIFGKASEKPLICIPGYPVSAWIVFDRLVQPLIRAMSRVKAEPKLKRSGILTRPLVSSLKHLEYVRVKCGQVGENTIVTPLSRGAGITMSLVNADAIVEVPREYEGYPAGSEVPLYMLKPWEEISERLVSIGSHDLLMDIINEIMIRNGSSGLSSTHSGTMGGVMAVKRGECHIAPVHVLNPENGVYNTHLLKQYLADNEVVIVKGIKRVQGLIVAEHNPEKITSITDLAERGLSFVNRQRGAGTRILFDYLCGKRNIPADSIKGYGREMNTHMSVAQAVLSGTADAGMGVESAARSMGLDFIPIGEEDYDFILRTEVLDSEAGQTFLNVLCSEQFKLEVNRLGGYILDAPGKIIRKEEC